MCVIEKRKKRKLKILIGTNRNKFNLRQKIESHHALFNFFFTTGISNMVTYPIVLLMFLQFSLINGFAGKPACRCYSNQFIGFMYCYDNVDISVSGI